MLIFCNRWGRHPFLLHHDNGFNMSAKEKTNDETILGQVMTPLQQEWTTLWTRTLPVLASSESKIHGECWPVCVDRSIARIILDNAAGISQPWTESIEAPATKHMTDTQLQACIDLSRSLINNEVSIWDLDTTSRKIRNLEPITRPAPPSLKRKRTPTPDSHSPSTTCTKQTSKQLAATSWQPYSLINTYPTPQPTKQTSFPTSNTSSLPLLS